MFLFAAARPWPSHTPEQIVDCLTRTPNGRIALAMQDMYQNLPDWDIASRYGTKMLGRWFLRSLWRSVLRRFSGSSS